MMKESDMKILCHLRKDARITLTNLSKKTGIPISTIFERIKHHEMGIIKRHTALLDFTQMGFTTRANMAIKVDKKQKEEMSEYLAKHQNINSMYKVTNGYDFMVECIFRSFLELEEFSEKLEERFRIKQKQVYYIIDELKREEFFADPCIAVIVN